MMRTHISLLYFAICIIFFLLVILASRSHNDWIASMEKLGLKSCAEKWEPRPVQLTTTGICRVQINGEWWPESAIKLSPSSNGELK